MLKKITKNSNLIFLLIVILLTIPSVFSLLHLGFPQTDDGNWMVIRFSAFYETLRNGQFPVRFLTRLNFGYGYPVSDFLYPLFMYLGVPIHILGFNFLNTIKVILVLSLFSSSVFTFLWLRKLFDNLSSVVGSLFYTLFPYHLYDVYVRGSVGEVLSLAILPFVLWQIERGSFILTSLGIALLITAHNTLAFLFLPLIFVYGLIKDKKISQNNVLTLFFGLCISSFFWIPALFDSQYTVFSKIKVSDFSSYFINGKLELLGAVLILLILESIFYLLRKKDKFFFSLFLGVLVLSFLTISQSQTVWNLLPVSNLIQFPFRIISLIIPISAFMLGFLLSREKGTKKQILAVTYLIVIFISASFYLLPKSYQIYDDSFYSTNVDSTTVKNEYMPLWVKKTPSSLALSKVSNLTGKEEINIGNTSVNRISFDTNLKNSEIIQVNTIYFPGWSALVNGKKTDISYNNDLGVIRLNLPKGENKVQIEFGETNVRIFADLLSIIGLVLVFFFGLLKKHEIHK